MFLILKKTGNRTENVLHVQFSLANYVEAFSVILYFAVLTTVCQCFDADTDSDSDCELTDSLHVVAGLQINAHVYIHVFVFIKVKEHVFLKFTS